MEKENYNPLVYDSRMSDVAQDSTFGIMPSPFPHGGAPKSERKFANIAHSAEPDEKMTKLIQENFDLRLHCYHLKEKLDKVTNGADVSTDLNRVAYLESRVESLTRELDSKRRLLTEGSEALSLLDEQLRSVTSERDDAESRCAKLRDQLMLLQEQANASGCVSTSDAAAAAAAAAAAPGASTSSGSQQQQQQQLQSNADLNEQRVSKMAGLLQGSWRRQHKMEARLAKAEADANRLRELEIAAEECGFELARLPDRVAELNRELAAANDSLAEAGTVIENLQTQLDKGRAEIDELNQLLDEYRQEVASLHAEKAARAQPNGNDTDANRGSGRSACHGGPEDEEAGSFWESVRLSALNRRSLTVGGLTAGGGGCSAGVGSLNDAASNQIGRSGGVSALVEGLGALSLLSTTAERDLHHQQQQQQILGISAEARQCLNASHRRFYHLCVTSLASSGGIATPDSNEAAAAVVSSAPATGFATEAVATADAVPSRETDVVGRAAASTAGLLNAEMSVSELNGDGFIDQVSQLRTQSLPLSMNAAAAMSATELRELKGVFDRLLGQLRGAEAGLQAALSTTVGNVSALLGSAAAIGGVTRNSSTRLLGEDDSFVMNHTASAFGHREASITGGVAMATMFPPATPGLRSMEEENALAMQNLQDNVAEIKQAMSGFGRISCMLEALLAGAVAEASSILLDDQPGRLSSAPMESLNERRRFQHHHRHRHHHHREHQPLLESEPAADEWATPPSPPPSSSQPSQQHAIIAICVCFITL